MSPQKFHLGKNGPAPCHANVRVCKYEIEGTQAEVNAIWDQQQEEELRGSLLTGVARTDLGNIENFEDTMKKSQMQASKVLSVKSNYAPAAAEVRYPESEKDVAMKLALTNLSKLSYTPIREQDERWSSNGCSEVERYILEDGTVGYFKSFGKNSHLEDAFEDYGTTSLGASINEANSYRMAQALGGEYAKMVPETVIREVNGSIGTLQLEVKQSTAEIDYNRVPELKDDYRRAAIFDFVIGNLDRHDDNYLYGESEDPSKRPAIRLIDNSFSFPPSRSEASMNSSIFSDNSGHRGYFSVSSDYTIPMGEYGLTDEESASLIKARSHVENWIEAKTIRPRNGKKTLERIDFLLENNTISSFSDYHCDY